MIPSSAALFFCGVILFAVSFFFGWCLHALWSAGRVARAVELARRETENLFHAHGVRDPREATSARIQ
ncbi:hypothetical protein HNR46_001616 [Haloferula luteola]|uniref:Uncharacterized protein n=1 Tax=Haloferula luteola TaxID=595692 RepID=A0A840VBS3_9BACT|nr:hypothetical protein [Haloferula luteola]